MTSASTPRARRTRRWASARHCAPGSRPLRQESPVHFRQQRPARVERLVATPVRRRDHRVHEDLGAIVQNAGRVTPEDHRQPIGRQPDPAQTPDVVMVQRGIPHPNPHPSIRHRRALDLADLQTGERIVGGLASGIRSEHAPNCMRCTSEWICQRGRFSTTTTVVGVSRVEAPHCCTVVLTAPSLRSTRVASATSRSAEDPFIATR